MTVSDTILRVAGGQLVRLKVTGQGPAAILCHESPRSSAALLPLAERLRDRFTCILIDTPGFGLSDPMPMDRPEIPDFAAVAVEVARTLGLGAVPFYGTHTGAAIAVEAACQAPDIVSAAILDGYAIFTPNERDQLLASYLTPLRPGLMGELPVWLWARVRDQFTAFPWNQVGDGSKLGFGPPPLYAMQRVVDDFLQAGDNYRIGYAAAFRYDHFEPLGRVTRPAHIVTREDDLLFAHMERARDAGPNVSLHPLSPDRAAWGEKIAALLAQHAGAEDLDAETILQRASDHAGDRGIANTAAGPVAIREEGRGAPVVLLHDVPGGTADLDGLAARLGRAHRVLRLSLPGLDGGRLPEGAEPSLDLLCKGVAEALASVGASDAPIVACGASLPVALGLDGKARIVALDPWPQVTDETAGHLPDLSPRWDGTHLLAAFWWARDYEIYKPWFNRINTETRAIGHDRDVLRIHNRFAASVLAGEAGVKIAALLYGCDVGDMARGAADRVRVLAYCSDPDAGQIADWAEATLGPGRIETVPRGPEWLAPKLADLLS